MQIVYLLQVHKEPLQVKRLISALDDKDVLFYIHVDAKSEIDEFAHVVSGENIKFVKNRVDCIWGDFSQVQATLSLIRKAIDDGLPDDTRLVLLSGQDYPVKPKEYIKSFFYKNKDISYINIENIGRHSKRINAHKVQFGSGRKDYSLLSVYFLRSVIRNIIRGNLKAKDLAKLFIRKKLPDHLKIYRGAQWWSINMENIKEILNYYHTHKDEMDAFFKNTICSDELFFQSIIMTIGGEKTFKIEPSLTYDNWTRNVPDLPVTFTEGDYEELKNLPEGKLFARKFDVKKDTNILNKLDILNNA